MRNVYLVHEINGNPTRLEKARSFIVEGLERGLLNPTIDKIFTLDEIVDAHRHLESNCQFGKIIVKV